MADSVGEVAVAVVDDGVDESEPPPPQAARRTLKSTGETKKGSLFMRSTRAHPKRGRASGYGRTAASIWCREGLAVLEARPSLFVRLRPPIRCRGRRFTE
jgi:hypothetical protein